MKRITSIILAVVLTLTFSFSTFAISISNSFKGPLTELDEDEYIFSFGKLGEDENPREVGFKIGSRKYTLSDAALYKAKQSKTFGIGFQDNENVLGDSYNVIPYFIDENGEETTGESYTVNKAEFADLNAGVKLASISVNGTPLSFFKETVKTYDYGISYEDMEINNPTVTATAKEETSEVSYAPFSTGVNITVTSANGETDTYTVNFKPESASTTTKIAEKMGEKRRDAVGTADTILQIAETNSNGTKIYMSDIKISGIQYNLDTTNPNRYDNIPYITFDIPENINLQKEVKFSVRIKTSSTIPEELKVYAYEYNENALPYYETEYKDYGYLGKILNPEGWDAYKEATGNSVDAFVDYSCDISNYIAKLVSLGEKKATIAIFYDSDAVTSLWNAYNEKTYTGGTTLVASLVANNNNVQNATSAAYKDGYPKLTYSTFDSYTPKNLAILSDIKVDGTSLENFDESVYSYSLGIENADNLPEVTATAKYPGTTVDITTDGTSKVITVTYGNFINTYTVNFGLLEKVTVSSIWQGTKVLKTLESSYKAYTIDSTDGIGTGVGACFDVTNSYRPNDFQSKFTFSFGKDDYVPSEGVYLTVRVKANYATAIPEDMKFCAYRYDPNAKPFGNDDNSCIGDMIDYVVVGDYEYFQGNSQWKEFTFDLTSYAMELKNQNATEMSVIFYFDFDQMEEYRELYLAGNYKYDTSRVNIGTMSIWPNTKTTSEYTTQNIYYKSYPKFEYYKIGE